MCRTFGSVIVVLFSICSLARGKVLLETMSYLIQSLTVVTVFRSTSKVTLDPRSTKRALQVSASWIVSDVWFLQLNTAVSLRPFWRQKAIAPAYTLLGPNRHFYLAIWRAKLRRSAKVAFSVANSEIRWSQSVPSTSVLTLSVQNV